MATTFDAVRFLRGEIRRSVFGPAWHGPALLEALEGVTAAEAFARPVEGAHTIAELAVHCVAWMEEVMRRLDGSAPQEPARGDWSAVHARMPGGWAGVLRLVRETAEALDAAVAAMPPARLLDTVGDGERDAPLGSGVKYAVMLSGVVQHSVYHAGQVVLLARAVRG
ncbi:MAG: DinB family protein [Gemmatimonadetes bacterium]|nr:DinB family protein [Gemmatimonadota bacterium]